MFGQLRWNILDSVEILRDFHGEGNPIFLGKFDC